MYYESQQQKLKEKGGRGTVFMLREITDANKGPKRIGRNEWLRES